MPKSSHEGKQDTLGWIKSKNIKTVLDVGAGEGTYANLLDGVDIGIDAIEVWQPYIDKFDLGSKYENIYNVDARAWEDWGYDLVILGDILEHMTKEEAIDLWNKVRAKAKYAIISIPIIHYPQGHEHGNPYEEHVKDDWDVSEVLESFEGITEYCAYKEVGVFYGVFE